MTTARTSTTRRSLRGAAFALVAGAGIALTPGVASANAGGPAAPAPAAQAQAFHAVAPAAAPSNAAQVAIDVALAQQGKPYAWGATGPSAFDCSGLITYAYQAAGVQLPRTSRMQATAGAYVPKHALQPGDLVFFYSPIGHVGMYIGNGKMVHSSTYGQPVKVVDVDSMYGYTTARRVV